MIKDPYSVLGVSKYADAETIKKAYRDKVKKYHPDLHPDDPHALEKMNEINVAYDYIQNPKKYEHDLALDQAVERQRSGSRGYQRSGSSYQNSGSQYQRSGNAYQNRNSYQSNGSSYQHTGTYREYKDPADKRTGERYSTYGSYSTTGSFYNQGNKSGTVYDTTPHIHSDDSAKIQRAINLMMNGNYAQAGNLLLSSPLYEQDHRWHYLVAYMYAKVGQYEHALFYINEAIGLKNDNMIYLQLQSEIRKKINLERYTKQNRSYYQKEETRNNNGGTNSRDTMFSAAFIAMLVIFYFILRVWACSI